MSNEIHRFEAFLSVYVCVFFFFGGEGIVGERSFRSFFFSPSSHFIGDIGKNTMRQSRKNRLMITRGKKLD